MRLATRLVSVLLFLLAAATTACGDSTGLASHPPNAIVLHSDAGDLVGSGKTFDYTQANSLISLGAGGGHLAVNVQGDENWWGDFNLPGTPARLEPGTYTGATVWWGLNSCNTTASSFTIDQASYDSTNLTSVDMSFEQHCNGAAAALHGTIHWRSDDKSHSPGPVNPPPTLLWLPPDSATPVGMNYVYLQSDTGDYIGQGRTYVFTPGTATIRVSAAGNQLSISVAAAESWDGGFKAMNWLTKLEPGYYGGLGSNPTKGALGWSHGNRGCSVVSGWFAIDHLTFSADTVTAVDVRFEQHCEAGPTALHGAIHWAR